MGAIVPAKGIGIFVSALAFLTFGVALLLYPAQVRDSIAASVLYCLSSLVPSLFPFMVLASFGVRSGAGEILGRLLAPVTCYGFRLPRVCGATLLLSFFGGYPAGARGVSLLLEEGKITREQAGRMMMFCVAPGPAFVVTFLGCGVLGSLEIGWLLFLAVTLSGLLLGLLTGLGKPLPKESSNLKKEKNGPALIRSISDASSATVKMCGCILLFAGLTATLRGSGGFQLVSQLLAATGLLNQTEAAVYLSFLLEVTGGTGDAARLGAGPILYAFGLAFGGLCVHLQAFSFFPDFPLSKGKFFLYRFLHGFLAAVLFFLLGRFLPIPSQPVWAAASEPISYGITASTAAGGLSLLLMCLAFLLFVSRGGSRKTPETLSTCVPTPKCAIMPIKGNCEKTGSDGDGIVPEKEKADVIRRQH